MRSTQSEIYLKDYNQFCIDTKKIIYSQLCVQVAVHVTNSGKKENINYHDYIETFRIFV